MKILISSLALFTVLIPGVILTACQSASEKERKAQLELNEAKADVKIEKENAATAEEWRVFKEESYLKIKENNVRIAELKETMNKPGKVFDDLYKKRITTLEERNTELSNRIETYDNSQSNWESFKREFNHDMDELGLALKDVTVKNTK